VSLKSKEVKGGASQSTLLSLIVMYLKTISKLPRRLLRMILSKNFYRSSTALTQPSRSRNPVRDLTGPNERPLISTLLAVRRNHASGAVQLGHIPIAFPEIQI